MLERISRRNTLQLAAVAGASALLPRGAAAQATAIPPAPIARRGKITDNYFGETLADPYRWMENSDDPDWMKFLNGQNAHARAILDRIPGRDALLAKIERLSGDTALVKHFQRAGGKLFFEQRPSGTDNFKLFLREKGADRVLIDPTQLGGKDGHFSLDWWRASHDGKYVVYGISPNGSEDSVLHIRDIGSGADMPARIANTENASPAWLPDNSGFFYNQLTGAVGTPERYLDSQVRFHRLGTPGALDPILMKRGLVPGVTYDKIQAPVILTFAGSGSVLLILGDIRPDFRLFVAPLASAIAGPTQWQPIADFADQVNDALIDDGDLYLISNKNAPRGRILKTLVHTPDLATAQVVVPQRDTVIEAISAAKDGLYLKLMDGGTSRLQRLSRAGQIADVVLPFDGTIEDAATDLAEDGALISLTGWLTAIDIWSVGADGEVRETNINPKPPIDTSFYETKRLFALAKDGVKIPYTLIYRKGLQLDGTMPLWISAYGSYGFSAYTPAFNPLSLALIDAGAIVGYANVRGGGEYGREWHRAGQLENKPNTWRDLIAVCEDACARKYTSPKHLAIGGRSAGGITVGRAMEERPDLFAAVIDGVGWSNPLRYVVEQNGYGEEPEWGAIAEKSGYEALKRIDSYHGVQDGTAYPAVLLTTGVTDPRVAPFHVGKMTARLQAATNSGKPVLLRVDWDAGHGIGSTRGQQDREAADTFAFLLWQTGVAGYQTKV